MVTISLSLTITEKKIFNYQKDIITQNPDILLEKIKLNKTKKLKNTNEYNENWKIYSIYFKLRYKGKEVDITDTLFCDDELIAPDLIDIHTLGSIKKTTIKKLKPLSIKNTIKKIKKFKKSLYKDNKDITDIKITIIKHTPLIDDKEWGDKWQAYTLEISFKYKKKDVDLNQIIFSDGRFIAPDLLNIDTFYTIKDKFGKKLTTKHYNKKHLIAGNIKAKHKLVIFSDPLCPFCKKFIPGLIDFTKKHKKEVGLYYYNFPLTSIHPYSEIIDKMILVAKKRHIMPIADIKYKIYTSKLDAHMSKKDIIDGVNKILKLKGKKAISQKDFTKDIEKTIKQDKKLAIELLIGGTPTLYTNGIKDSQRKAYMKIIK
jgi:protein-disulfide isomerase